MILQYLLLSIAIFAIYIAEAYNIAVYIAVLTYIAVNIGTSPQYKGVPRTVPPKFHLYPPSSPQPQCQVFVPPR